MDIKTAVEVVGLFRAALSALKDVVARLPTVDKQEAAEVLKKAEQQLLIAESQAAQGFGYPICHCTFPPQIMLLEGREGEHYRCSKCHREVTFKPSRLENPFSW